MEQSNASSQPQQPQYIVVKANKSVGAALVLTFLFGPLGMLYSTIAGGIIMLVISIIIGAITLGFGLLFTWPICMIWAAVAANNQNKMGLEK